jgi:hypothetical protein
MVTKPCDVVGAAKQIDSVRAEEITVKAKSNVIAA